MNLVFKVDENLSCNLEIDKDVNTFLSFAVEPRYTDPVIGAQPSFQQRLMELSALESETIRYEKSKKVKKKVRDRDS